MLREALRDEGIALNTTTANEHVPQIYRQLEMVKEQVRSTWNSLPYKKCPNRMISRMVENAFLGINALPGNSGMSCTISPWTVMIGTTIELNKHCKIEFGAYAKAHTKSSHETPRNPVQNPLYALDQQETSKVPTGSSTSVQDAASNDVPSFLSPSQRALPTAYTRSPMLTTKIMLLIYLIALEIPSHMATPPTM